MKDFGMLHVYTGTGKGKTSAALGLALRAVGHNAKVIMICFMKGDVTYGEAQAFHFLPNFTIKQMGRDSFVNFRNPDPVDIKMAQDAWKEGKRILLDRETDVLILDEINLAMAKKLLDTQEVVAFLHEYRKKTEVICTGREAPKELIDEADLVTDMQEVKHYFTEKNITIRDGIDH
ncbi:MAG: cob(I)yrinic acid a,c-diamide adenosyltransferase [Acidaminococcaceae bacterium]|nr:cob(I)yrinic acid a,c-diamide adenosyltransferase [Acidaminococcaceae bacterium]